MLGTTPSKGSDAIAEDVDVDDRLSSDDSEGSDASSPETGDAADSSNPIAQAVPEIPPASEAASEGDDALAGDRDLADLETGDPLSRDDADLSGPLVPPPAVPKVTSVVDEIVTSEGDDALREEDTAISASISAEGLSPKQYLLALLMCCYAYKNVDFPNVIMKLAQNQKRGWSHQLTELQTNLENLIDDPEEITFAVLKGVCDLAVDAIASRAWIFKGKGRAHAFLSGMSAELEAKSSSDLVDTTYRSAGFFVPITEYALATKDEELIDGMLGTFKLMPAS